MHSWVIEVSRGVYMYWFFFYILNEYNNKLYGIIQFPAYSLVDYQQFYAFIPVKNRRQNYFFYKYLHYTNN